MVHPTLYGADSAHPSSAQQTDSDNEAPLQSGSERPVNRASGLSHAAEEMLTMQALSTLLSSFAFLNRETTTLKRNLNRLEARLDTLEQRVRDKQLAGAGERQGEHGTLGTS